ncbi:hypothetical protein K491DRAFT_721863 [Lophiostoma macrostomum CBS 122681]|uniref:Rhodopsin domain-containing protein n=1 Tax=Lophiostoma macrostomum CBS 122681 TaxID=1314788 RepID=A0A6A6SST8_9PLEO|nr:hypothetical protein K491DRAFT_721863 [Lophiostoma macrostomum CBS 122681]
MVANRGPALQAVCATFVSTAFVATMLRVYVRLRLVKAFGWDDAFMIISLLAYIMFSTCVIAGIHYGTGRHEWDLTAENIYMAKRYWWLCYLAYCTATIAGKISIGLFLLRITVRQMHIRLIHTAMGLTVLTGGVFFFVTIFQCTPVSYFWDASKNGTCVDVNIIIGLTYLYSVVSAACDFTFGILPIFLVMKLNMSHSTKWALAPILSIACLASTAVIVRMAFVPEFRTNDFLYDTVDIAIWSNIEPGLGITAGSLATLRPLYRLLVSRVGWSQPSGHRLNESPNDAYPDVHGGHRRKPSGPFSLITMTRNDPAEETEIGLKFPDQIRLRDDLDHERSSDERAEKGFARWKVQAGENESEEDLNTQGNRGGIMKHTEVYMRSEASP